MRLAFGVRRLAFREIGIALEENDCSKNQTNNYDREVAASANQETPNAKRRTSNAKR
jgi:hypothetical protein